MLQLQRIEALLRIEQTGSFTAAAERLGCTQSAVSQQIATLERELELTLVRRRGRGVVLTEAGQRLVAHAERILAEVERAEADMRGLSSLESGRLRVSTFATAAATVLPPAIARFRERYPGVTLELSDLEPGPAIRALLDGVVDLALLFDFDRAPLDVDPAIAVDTFLEEGLYVGLPRSHPKATRKRLRFEELRDESWIGGSDTILRQLLEQLASEHRFTPRVAVESEDYGMIQGMIAAGLGVSLLPALAIFHQHRHVAAVPLTSGSGVRRVHLAALDLERELPAARAFSAMLQATLPKSLKQLDGVRAATG